MWYDHVYKIYFESFIWNIAKNTISGDFLSYSYDFELFERNCITRIMSYSHDIEFLMGE